MTTIAPAAPIQVLIVDDDPLTRMLLRHCLSVSGRFEVAGEAIDGRDGIEQAAARQPDIILLDVDMPVMDGLQAIPHLTRRSPRSTIIMVSGAGSSTDTIAAHAVALGARQFIEKRHRPDELLRRITDAWESAPKRAAAGTNTEKTSVPH